MDVKYALHGINFEWDSKKAAANLRKHTISFEFACEVFFDPFVFMSMTKSGMANSAGQSSD